LFLIFLISSHSLQRVMRRRKELQSEKEERESYNQNEKGEVITGNIYVSYCELHAHVQ